jgi:hypothetical protein
MQADRGDCLVRGSRLATLDGGWIAVQDVRPGDSLKLARGGSAPVVWAGRRLVDCRRHPQPHTVRPVRVRAGAFADDSPVCDLLLSPDHAVFVADVLIPVALLINGGSVVQEAWDTVEYFHVELPAHDAVLAEGLAVESFLDGAARHAFDGAAVRQLHPVFARSFAEAQGFAPRTFTGPAVQRVVRRLRERRRLGRAWRDGPGGAAQTV